MNPNSFLIETNSCSGAVLSPRKKQQFPSQSESVIQEQRIVREAVGLLDLSHWGLFRISGSDRKTFLHGLVSNDVKGLSPGNGNYSLLLTAHGKILADFFLLELEADYLLFGRESIVEPIHSSFKKYLIMEDVILTELTGSWSLLSIQGPQSLPLLQSLLQEGAIPVQEYQHALITLSGLPVRCVRLSHTAEIGYDLWIASEQVPTLWQILIEAGAAPVGMEALEILRIEAGIPILGKELDATVIPQEAALHHALSFKKGCYIGQETVARLHFRGHVNRELTGFVLETDGIPPSPLTIIHDEKEVGRLTSVTFSPSLHQTIALGYLRCDLRKPGMEVWTIGDNSPIRTIVHHLPFVEWVLNS